MVGGCCPSFGRNALLALTSEALAAEGASADDPDEEGSVAVMPRLRLRIELAMPAEKDVHMLLTLLVTLWPMPEIPPTIWPLELNSPRFVYGSGWGLS